MLGVWCGAAAEASHARCSPPPPWCQVVKVLNLEEGGAFTVSSADAILEALG